MFYKWFTKKSNMNKFAFTRTFQDDKETRGMGSIVGDNGATLFQFVTIERAWKDNQHGISCIPAGRYNYIKCLGSNKIPYPHLCVNNVTGRDGICVHRMNFFTDSEGCIGVGKSFADLNNDGELDVQQSTPALDAILNLLPEEGIIDISENFSNNA